MNGQERKKHARKQMAPLLQACDGLRDDLALAGVGLQVRMELVSQCRDMTKPQCRISEQNPMLFWALNDCIYFQTSDHLIRWWVTAVSALCEENPLVTGGFPSQRTGNTELQWPVNNLNGQRSRNGCPAELILWLILSKSAQYVITEGPEINLFVDSFAIVDIMRWILLCLWYLYWNSTTRKLQKCFWAASDAWNLNANGCLVQLGVKTHCSKHNKACYYIQLWFNTRLQYFHC